MFHVLAAIVLLFITWRLMRWKLRMDEIDISRRTLFLTAHPDDELMFFGPTMVEEIRARVARYALESSAKASQQDGVKVKGDNGGMDHKVHLVCLSNGNFYQEGHKREIELQNACESLQNYCAYSYSLSEKERTEHNFLEVTVVNDDHMQDGQHTKWPRESILGYVRDYVREHRIQRIITFDRKGISSHPNHCSIFEALNASNIRDDDIELWRLITVPLWRKYLSIFDIIPAYCSLVFMNRTRRIHLLSLIDYLFLVLALKKHKSQMVWFRYLYFCTSRYMFINTLEKF